MKKNWILMQRLQELKDLGFSINIKEEITKESDLGSFHF